MKKTPLLVSTAILLAVGGLSLSPAGAQPNSPPAPEQALPPSAAPEQKVQKQVVPDKVVPQQNVEGSAAPGQKVLKQDVPPQVTPEKPKAAERISASPSDTAPAPAPGTDLKPAPETPASAKLTADESSPARVTVPIPPGAPNSFADIADDLVPAVVNISSTLKSGAAAEELEQQMPEMPQFPPGSPFQDFFEEFFNNRGGLGGGGNSPLEPTPPPSSLGSGFVVDADKGFIVTNYHVVKDADEVRVTFQDDTTIDAKLVGKDEKMDLAVLKVDTKKKLTAVKFGDSDKMRVGDWVLAIGNPFGLGGTVTAGIVSAQQRNINAGPYDDFIQTDASINRGNSGGPMFDLAGNVIGINTAIFSPSGGSVGIGFAIPSNLAKSVVGQLIEYGKTRRGWIGVRIQMVTEEIAESLGIKDIHGALVASITPGGPAEAAKLQRGDVIVEFDGKTVNAMRNLPRIVAETPIGKTATFKYWRNGTLETGSIKVAELEKAEETGLLDNDVTGKTTKKETVKGTSIDKLGFTLGALSEATRKENSVPQDVDGVLVTKVTPNGEALSKGVTPGDVIVEINREKPASPRAAADIIAKAERAGKTSVLLLLNREGDVRFVALRLKK